VARPPHSPGQLPARKVTAGRPSASGPQKTAPTAPPLPTDGSASGLQRQVRAQTAGSGPRGTAQPAGRGAKAWRRGLGLQPKFTLVLALITAGALIGLGLAMSAVTHRYLFSQKVHSGIEVAKSVAAIPVAVKRIVDAKAGGEPRAVLTQLFESIRAWGSRTDLSDVDSIGLFIGDVEGVKAMTATYLGQDQGVRPAEAMRDLFIPKLGETIVLPDGITVYPGVKRAADGTEIPIYRFKIALPQDFGRVSHPDGRQEPAHVRVDISASSLTRVTRNMMLTILVWVLVAMVLAGGIAHWMARTITRPVTILVDDMQAVSKGDLDHRTKPHSRDEIGLLAIEFDKMTASLKAAQAQALEQEREQERAKHEMAVGAEVQRHLLPSATPGLPGWEIAAFYKGAKAVSGDYFDFIDLGDGLHGFIIADVSGKGVPGAMVMAVARTTIRLVAPRHRANAAEALKEINRLITKQIKRGMFVTALYGIVDVATGTLTYASAGHNPMAVFRASGRTMESATGKGIALGFNEGPIFDRTIEQHRLVLGSGDCFVLYTDGFPEAMDAENNEFGDDTFLASIQRHAPEGAQAVIKGVVADVAAHRGRAEQSDDLTMIVVRRA
jgi:serine phosphatase RsbU (regulator of sigma subunit)